MRRPGGHVRVPRQTGAHLARRIAAALGLLFLVGACGFGGFGGFGGSGSGDSGGGGPAGADQYERTGKVGDRTYRVYDPPGARALLVALHGFNGSAATFETLTGFDTIARQDQMRVVYAEGYHHSWNAGFCCGDAVSSGVDDVAFLSAVILRERLPSPVVFVAGFSNGGFMAYRLACRAPGLLTAIAVVGADSEECTPSPGPLPAVLAIQGTADDRTGNRVWGMRDGAWANVEPSATIRWKKLGASTALVSVPGGVHEWYRTKPDASTRAGEFFLRYLVRD